MTPSALAPRISWIVAVEADQRMPRKVFRPLRGAVRAEIACMCGCRQGQVADFPGDQLELGRPHHAQRNVGLAQQQVFDRIGRHELDRDTRKLLADAAQQRRQHVVRDDGAGGDPHRAFERAGRPFRHERRLGQPLLRFRYRLVKPQRGFGGFQSLQRAVKERNPELLFQRLDVPPEGRLAVADLAGGGRQ